MKRILCFFLFLTFVHCSLAQDLEPFELTEDWLSHIEELAPLKTSVSMEGSKNILIFSLHTGYEHWTIPHTEAVVQLVAEKTGAFKVTTSKDISVFESENLATYDAIVLNNNCSMRDHRNIFWDILKKDDALNNQQQKEKAVKLEQNLFEYVKNGGGLMVLHGGITMQNNTEEFGKMVGGSFDYHPKQQRISVKLVDASHPLVKAFDGVGFEHVDEPYFFNNAYFDYNFRPLLYMEANELKGKKAAVNDNIKYIAWIKPYGDGRVFYASPSHNAHSYENPQLLQFLVDGLQYAVGVLECDDSPIEE